MKNEFKQMRIEVAQNNIEKRTAILIKRENGQKLVDATYDAFKTLKRVENKRLAELKKGRLVEMDCYVSTAFDGDLLVELARAHPDFQQSIMYLTGAKEMIIERLDFQTTNHPLYKKIMCPEPRKESPARYIWEPLYPNS